ncbi:hypothetical protein [Bradyrhizobium sp. Tv2a-2]|uniref:hypothetical protein n=1 Tax=Bradyrhizobium sp. Tv2a-2 TaxID=113395 RepID=UPI000A0153FA|nr:hypothetical protein [Bradyrhizobium sp. Tv2a-2]
MFLQDYLLKTYPGLRSGQTSWNQVEIDFAEKVGTSRQNINRYRKFQRHPRPPMVARIRKLTNGLVAADDHLPPEQHPSKSRSI